MKRTIEINVYFSSTLSSDNIPNESVKGLALKMTTLESRNFPPIKKKRGKHYTFFINEVKAGKERSSQNLCSFNA